jgi:hypothetical protein
MAVWNQKQLEAVYSKIYERHVEHRVFGGARCWVLTCGTILPH